jgi:phosphoserine phosphatase
MAFEVGQKVVCISATNDLVRGRIYRILRVHRAGGTTLLNVDQTQRTDAASSFNAERFRLIVERKTDISAFRKNTGRCLNQRTAVL